MTAADAFRASRKPSATPGGRSTAKENRVGANVVGNPRKGKRRGPTDNRPAGKDAINGETVNVRGSRAFSTPSS